MYKLWCPALFGVGEWESGRVGEWATPLRISVEERNLTKGAKLVNNFDQFGIGLNVCFEFGMGVFRSIRKWLGAAGALTVRWIKAMCHLASPTVTWQSWNLSLMILQVSASKRNEIIITIPSRKKRRKSMSSVTSTMRWCDINLACKHRIGSCAFHETN